MDSEKLKIILNLLLSMKKRISILIAALSIFGITLAQQEPLNSPAKISIDNNQVSISYNGKTIFTGTIQSPGKNMSKSFTDRRKSKSGSHVQGKDLAIGRRNFRKRRSISV